MYETEPIPEHERIDELLRSVDRPGDYCVGGRIFTPMPRVIVEGAGELSFPVPEAQIEALIAAAERSPYGKGAETVLDTSVRDSWQIDATDVRLDGRAWPDSLAKIMDLVAAGLGLSAERLGAELYKLLVYRPGGFFAEHRDTEKVPGMVATLSLSLPTPGAGGELVVRHAGRSATFDMAALEPSELLFTAFYSDCPHEVLPVRDGHRVSLVFNLFAGSPDDGLVPPEYRKTTTQTAECLARWREEGGVDKLAWVLDHEYSEDGLSFDTLKNKDAAVAKVLAKAARRAGCELHAAVLRFEEEGYPDENPPYDWDGQIENAPQAEIGELRSRIRTLDGWAACDGGRPRFGPIDLRASELLSRRALTDAEPDERRVYPTGNEGVTMALVYRHGALVVWPGDKTLDIVAGNSVGHAVSWVATQRGRPADEADEGVRRLLARLIRIWPARSWPTRSQDRYEMLRLLHAVGDGDLGADFLQRVVTTQYDGSENVVLAEVLTLIGAGEAGAFLPKLIEKHLARRPKEIVALLVLAGGSPRATTDPARRDAMREAAESALSGLESALRSESDARARSERERSAEPWRALHRYPDSPKEWIDPGTVCDLFVLADRLGLADAAAAAARAIGDHPTIVTPDRMLPAALEGICGRGGIAETAAYSVLWRRSADILLARSAAAPVTPSDWTIEVEIPCDCDLCARLRAFCGDPAQRVERFESRQDIRWHFRQKIGRDHRDLDYESRWLGGTYTLVCTKSRASHLRRLEEYAEDLRRMESLLACAPDAEGRGSADGRVVRLKRAMAVPRKA